MVARPEAIAITDRWLGMSTAVPSPIRDVRTAARPRWTNASSHSGALSKLHSRA